MASNTIKGLTVEIGGDTTKLGKALENVNKKGRDLSAELGEINKLLKLDPGNTDLLAQKQKVLAEAIANTADKLGTLKDAEKQVQKQFERGEVSEEQVRALQREIIATEKKMKSYQKAAQETADQTKEVGDAADEASEGAGKLGSALKTTGSVAVKGFAAVGAAVAAAVGALTASAEATREYRTEMGKLDTAFTTAGHSSEAATKTYQALQGVLGETDQAVEAANHLAQLAETEQDLEKWTDIATGVYATFGASLPIEGLTEAANETAKVGTLTGSLADALNWAGVNEEEFQAQLDACSTEQERQALITETLTGLYSKTAEAYRETNAEIIRANEANEAWTATLAEAGASVEPILTDVKMLGASLLSELMPGITGVTDAFRGLVNGEEGSAQAVGEALSGLISQVLSKIVEMLPQVVEMAISLVTSLVQAIVAELPNLVNTIVTVLIDNIPALIDGALTLLMAIVDAIGLVLPPLLEALPSIVLTIVTALVDFIPTLIDGAVQFLLAIVQAIPLIMDELYSHIPLIVDTIVDGLLDNLPLLVDGAVQLLNGIITAFPDCMAAIYENAPSIVQSLASGLLKAIPALIKAGGQLLEGLVEGMMDFDLGGAISKIGGAVVNGFKKIFDIHSPSRVMEEMGQLIDEGLAVGITDNANTPVNAMGTMTKDMLDEAGNVDGLAIERNINHTYTANASAASVQSTTMLGKLDQILEAIKRGQVLTIDGKTLVGSTADRYDLELGQRRVLAERGAI